MNLLTSPTVCVWLNLATSLCACVCVCGGEVIIMLTLQRHCMEAGSDISYFQKHVNGQRTTGFHYQPMSSSITNRMYVHQHCKLSHGRGCLITCYRQPDGSVSVWWAGWDPRGRLLALGLLDSQQARQRWRVGQSWGQH